MSDIKSGVGGIDGFALGREAMLNNQVQRAQNLKGLGQQQTGPEHEAEVKSAATQFEALMVQEMLKSMWASVPKDGMLSGGREAELYQDMFQQSLATTIAENQSLGIKDVLIKDIKATEKRLGKAGS